LYIGMVRLDIAQRKNLQILSFQNGWIDKPATPKSGAMMCKFINEILAPAD
jgi:hypothetical protein